MNGNYPTHPTVTEQDLTFRQYVDILWRRRYLILAVALAITAAVAGFSFIAPPVYETQALIQISGQSATIYSTPSSAVQVIKSRFFLDAIAARVPAAESGRMLQRRASAEPIRDTGMIRLKVRNRDAQQAKDIADAIAAVFVERASERVRERRRVTEARLASVTAQLGDVRATLELTRETLTQLQRRDTSAGADRGFARSFALNALGLSEGLYSSLLDAQRNLTVDLLAIELPSLVEPPATPLAPIALRKVMNVLLGAVFGLMAGTMLAFTIDYFRPLGRVDEPLRQQPVPAQPSRKESGA